LLKEEPVQWIAKFCPCTQVAEPDSTWWLLNAVRFWWDPQVCFVINWQISGLIASRAVNFSLHQYDQNVSGAHSLLFNGRCRFGRGVKFIT